MALVSIAEAAKLVGKDRKTLYRDATKGRLTMSQDATGVRQVDIAELIRVYGELRDTRHSPATVALPQNETQNATDATASKLALLEAENAHLRERLADKEKMILFLENIRTPKPWWKVWS